MILCTRIYIEPTEALMVQARKEASNPSKTAMREHKGAQSILYNYDIK